MAKYEMHDPDVRAQSYSHKPTTERKQNGRGEHIKPAISGEAFDDTVKFCALDKEPWPCTWKQEYTAWDTQKQLLELMFRDAPYTAEIPYEHPEEG